MPNTDRFAILPFWTKNPNGIEPERVWVWTLENEYTYIYMTPRSIYVYNSIILDISKNKKNKNSKMVQKAPKQYLHIHSHIR